MMTWQDMVIGGGQFIFLIALIPSIRSEEKPAFWTCIMTATILTVYIPTQFSLGLYFGTVSSAFIAAGWWILTVQSWRRSVRNNPN